MTDLEPALLELCSFLDEHRTPYMVVGGFANIHWGIERFTHDLDLAVEIEPGALDGWLESLALRFKLRRADAAAFAKRNHLIRLETNSNVPVDLMVAVLPYERAAIRRAVEIPLGGRVIRMCAPEDLIIYKLASERLQDAADVEGIIFRQAKRLDRAYLETRVRELAAGLERPEIVDFYTRTLTRADSVPE
jgi:hypothetical protein